MLKIKCILPVTRYSLNSGSPASLSHLIKCDNKKMKKKVIIKKEEHATGQRKGTRNWPPDVLPMSEIFISDRRAGTQRSEEKKEGEEIEKVRS